jgi:hypothetical protein
MNEFYQNASKNIRKGASDLCHTFFFSLACLAQFWSAVHSRREAVTSLKNTK